MSTRLFTVCIVLLLAQAGMAQPPAPNISRPASSPNAQDGFDELTSRGYTPLFNGKDLSGWRNPYSYGQAEVVDGEIHLQANKKFFLVTERKYSDFRLSVDIHLPEGPANSGVMFRCHVDEDEGTKVYGYQAECDGSDRRWSGGLYDEARRGWIWPSTEGRSTDQFLNHAEESKAFFAEPRIRDALNRNGWNRYEITCVKDLIRIEINGVQTVRLRDATDASGFIGIQHHGEKGATYRFRNLFIKELPEIPAEEHADIIEQEPVSIKRVGENATLIDFGKVAFGNIVMPVPDGRGLAKVHFGEKLKAGRIDQSPPGTVRYGMTPIRLGGQRGNWIVPAPVDVRNVEQAGLIYANPPAALTPGHWRSIMPFRWVEIEGVGEDFPYELIRRRAAFDKSWNDDASAFESSNAELNRIWDLCKYSIKATTFAGVYVDGDRERIPYEADAYLNQLSHYTTDDDVTMAARSFDWLMENGTWPTEWSPHMVFMAYAQWQYSGDTQWLEQRYESLKSRTLMHRSADDGLVRSSALDQSRHDIVDWPKKERDSFVFTEINTVVNAFHIEALEQMAEMARAVGKDADADAFDSRIVLAKRSLVEKLFDTESGIFRDGIGTDHSSIHANFFPLAFGLVPEEKVAGVVSWLEGKQMQCSPYAAQYFMEALFQNGSDQKAMELILAEGDRSWNHMLDSGTTITWEAWDLKYKPNQDWNHAWGAAPANLLPRFVLGATPASPGWKSATIRPNLSGLTHASGRVPTPQGPIEVAWKLDSELTVFVKLPDGVSATLDLPATDGSTGVTIDGKPVKAQKVAGRWIVQDAVEGAVSAIVK
ncbi:MAG: family 78 glycoside hydrolase catalytic domain [Aureliella sp.]